MATTPDEDQPQSPFLQRASVSAATAVRSRGALAVALSCVLALMTMPPQPFAAAGVFVLGLVIFDVGRQKR